MMGRYEACSVSKKEAKMCTEDGPEKYPNSLKTKKIIFLVKIKFQ